MQPSQSLLDYQTTETLLISDKNYPATMQVYFDYLPRSGNNEKKTLINSDKQELNPQITQYKIASDSL